MSTTTKTSAYLNRPTRGARFTCEQCGMAIEVVADCECTNGEPQFFCCGQPLTPSGRTLTAKTKQAFVEQTQKSMDKAKETLGMLRQRATQVKDATQEEVARETEALNEQLDKLRESLNEVADSSGEAWRDLAKGVSDSWSRFKTACEKAASRYQA